MNKRRFRSFFQFFIFLFVFRLFVEKWFRIRISLWEKILFFLSESVSNDILHKSDSLKFESCNKTIKLLADNKIFDFVNVLFVSYYIAIIINILFFFCLYPEAEKLWRKNSTKSLPYWQELFSFSFFFYFPFHAFHITKVL